MVCIALVFSSVILGSSLGSLSRSDGRVVGGLPADIHNFPYQLSLEYASANGFKHFCGASVISEDWAVTAAHCVNGLQIESFRLRAGTSFRDTGGEIYEIAEIIPHPEFDQRNADYDIAVIKVSKPFQYSDVLQPLVLAQTTPSPGTIAVVSGWGSQSSGGADAKQLQQVAINVIDHEECSEDYQLLGGITPRMLCAGIAEGGKDACGGDSGGPLVAHGNQLVGVVSWGFGCGDGRYPGVYADVAYLLDWINSSTQGTLANKTN